MKSPKRFKNWRNELARMILRTKLGMTNQQVRSALPGTLVSLMNWNECRMCEVVLRGRSVYARFVRNRLS